jgi:hypothetical protein
MIFENAMRLEAVQGWESINRGYQFVALSRHAVTICLLSRGSQTKKCLWFSE